MKCQFRILFRVKIFFKNKGKIKISRYAKAKNMLPADLPTRNTNRSSTAHGEMMQKWNLDLEEGWKELEMINI